MPRRPPDISAFPHQGGTAKPPITWLIGDSRGSADSVPTVSSGSRSFDPSFMRPVDPNFDPNSEPPFLLGESLSLGSTNSPSAPILTPSDASTAVKETTEINLEYNPATGRKRLNSYEILREIGRGQHGKVKVAREFDSGRFVAIKVIDKVGRPRLGKSAKPNAQQEKIKKEISIMKKCRHPNIVQLLEVIDDPRYKKIYLVLEYLDKGEIQWQRMISVNSNCVQTQQTPHAPHNPQAFQTTPHSSSPPPLVAAPAMDIRQVQAVLRDVLLGLEYLHMRGVVHRDIKPANLLLSRDNHVKISDFGVSFAYPAGEGGAGALELAKTAGTPAFFAPELCCTDLRQNRPKVSAKIDIWALGVTLYCLLYGRVPFMADSEFELFSVICETPLQIPDESEVSRPSSGSAAVDSAMVPLAVDLLYRMLEKDPQKRIELQEIKRHAFVLYGLQRNCSLYRKLTTPQVVAEDSEFSESPGGSGCSAGSGCTGGSEKSRTEAENAKNSGNSGNSHTVAEKSVDCAENSVPLPESALGMRSRWKRKIISAFRKNRSGKAEPKAEPNNERKAEPLVAHTGFVDTTETGSSELLRAVSAVSVNSEISTNSDLSARSASLDRSALLAASAASCGSAGSPGSEVRPDIPGTSEHSSATSVVENSGTETPTMPRMASSSSVLNLHGILTGGSPRRKAADQLYKSMR